MGIYQNRLGSFDKMHVSGDSPRPTHTPYKGVLVGRLVDVEKLPKEILTCPQVENHCTTIRFPSAGWQDLPAEVLAVFYFLTQPGEGQAGAEKRMSGPRWCGSVG